MERRLISCKSNSGSALVVVLIMTFVGLLFGAGALLLFKFQCQLRIDRQHELEKVYAVRSVLNYLKMYSGEIKDDKGKEFSLRTNSERDLKLVVKPVRAIFPDITNENHLWMESKNIHRTFTPNCINQYNVLLDYEYGPSGITNEIQSTSQYQENGGAYGLAFRDSSSTNGVNRWWVNIGMRDTGGWLQEDYGRRYSFYPYSYVAGTNGVQDVFRLCIIRNVTNDHNAVGCRRGWPLSREGEKALVFQVSPRIGDSENNAEIEFLEYEFKNGNILMKTNAQWKNCPSICNMGLQLAGDKASLFYISNKSVNDGLVDLSSQGYTFYKTVEMSPEIYEYFADGIWTNDYGRIQAPELRAVIEVSSVSEKQDIAQIDFISNLRVSPAYQYDIFLEHPDNITNLATVAQKMGEYNRTGKGMSIITYDTHGTENKGFRRDERLHSKTGGGAQ